MAALNNLKIGGFRGIRNLDVPALGAVNLVVGDNNSGKTSVLEALQLLRSPSPGTANLYRTARLRESLSLSGANSIYESFISMFPKGGKDKEIFLSADTDSGTLSCSLRGRESRILLDPDELEGSLRRQLAGSGEGFETDEFRGTLEYRDGDVSRREEIRINRYSSVSGTAVGDDDGLRIVYVSPFEHLRGNIISLIVKNDSYREICVRALQLFDPDIEDMMIYRSDTGNRPVEYLKHRRLGAMPLSTYGDGIKKVLALSNAAASARDGILLIDEIETAIHKRYYDDVFRFIVKVSKAFNVQMFITTHSLEAIDGLLATQDYDSRNGEDDIMVVTLRRENGRTLSRVMSGRDVSRNREAFGFEVRL